MEKTCSFCGRPASQCKALFGGLHGENQLGGCGLTDAFVFGHAAAESIMGVTTYTDV